MNDQNTISRVFGLLLDPYPYGTSYPMVLTTFFMAHVWVRMGIDFAETQRRPSEIDAWVWDGLEGVGKDEDME
jgi:hypothetical protein